MYCLIDIWSYGDMDIDKYQYMDLYGDIYLCILINRNIL